MATARQRRPPLTTFVISRKVVHACLLVVVAPIFLAGLVIFAALFVLTWAAFKL